MKNQILLGAVVFSVTAVSALGQNPNPNQPSQAQPPGAQSGQAPPPTAGARVSQGLSNLVTDHRFEDLPPAVQKTVREQAAGQKIGDIDRETRTGRIVWEIEIEKQGRNTEIHVAEDGSLVDTGLLGRTEPAPSTAPAASGTAVGNPASGQTGRVFAGTSWEDLPPAVQQKAAQFGGKANVQDIDRESENGRAVYEIEFKREGRNLEIEFFEDGTILKSNDPAGIQGIATPPPGAARNPSVQAQPPSTQPRPQTVPPSTSQQPQSTPGTQPRP